jgi:hypothetical protein
MRTGLHCNTVRDPAKILDYYRRSHANVAKFMEFDQTLFDQLKALDVTLIGRIYTDDQQLGGSVATEFINEIIARAREYPQVDFWEGYNEDFQEGSALSRYADFEIRRMQAMEDAGLRAKAVIGCFSTGRPEVVTDEDWQRFRPALEFALPRGHALGLHEYSGPYMLWLCGENQWDVATNAPKRVDDPCLSPFVEGWLTLRYRKAYAYFREWGLGGLPVYITEGGIDDVWPRPGPQGKGYKDYVDTVWARLPGIGDYAQQRRWYMWQTSHDLPVRGVVDFGFESEDPAWGSFDMATDPEMLNRVILLESDLPVGHIEGGGPIFPEPPVEPPPLEPDVAPSVQPILVLQSGWDLLDCARYAYPDEQGPAQVEANARAIARLNGLDYDAVTDPERNIWLPRYLVMPRYKVARV